MMAISEFDRIFWGPVDRSEISIRVNIDTAPQTAVNQLCATTLSGSQMRKFICYSNDKSAANGTILAGLEKTVLGADPSCDVCSFTSDLPPVMKLWGCSIGRVKSSLATRQLGC